MQGSAGGVSLTEGRLSAKAWRRVCVGISKKEHKGYSDGSGVRKENICRR